MSNPYADAKAVGWLQENRESHSAADARISRAPWAWSGKLRAFPGTASEIAFPLGGIGTGNVSLGARGEFRDWEIQNRPGKGVRLPNTYFAIWARPQNSSGGADESSKAAVRVLESRLNPPFTSSHGIYPQFAGGLPRLEHSTLYAEYPLVKVDFADGSLPVQVTLEAFTPFIPLNPEDSGIPGAVLRYRVRNPGSVKVDVTIVGSLANPLGMEDTDVWGAPRGQLMGGHVNEFRRDRQLGLSGIMFTSRRLPQDHPSFGNLVLATTHPQVTVKRTWLRGSWWDDVQEFWDDLASDGRLTDLGYSTPSDPGRYDTGSLGAWDTLSPGEERVFEFILTWYFPNRVRGWWQPLDQGNPVVRNRYATRFGDAWEVARYLVLNLERLERETLAFHDAFFGSTLPPEVLDRAAANLAVLRSPTCFWLEDDWFMGWEGCFDREGCCHGNCTHVWNYEQALAFLFPSLERNMRRQEFTLETAEDGKMSFRVGKAFSPLYQFQFHAAADGQLGAIMRLYRDWKLSGDFDFLLLNWEGATRALDYALRVWDTDKDLVLDGQQHNTYDIEFYGPNPMTGLFLVGALRAMAEMARTVEAARPAAWYEQAARTAAERLDRLTWNGEYYVQRLEDINQYKYQFGQGCLSDQLLAQTAAHLYGLGYLLPAEHVRQAASAIFRLNFRRSFAGEINIGRAYVFNDEEGLVLCSWPEGRAERPRFPFPYSDEVWTGIEYEVATLLVYEGMVDEALAIVRAVAERHDGRRRNPWNEVECGHHYARSMASWGLVVALSGFTFDMAKGEMSFAPRVRPEGDFQCFWSTGRGWGIYRERRDFVTGELIPEIEVLYGDLTGVRVKACGREWVL